MATKALLALALGTKLRRFMPQRMLRVVAAASLAVLGVMTLIGEAAR